MILLNFSFFFGLTAIQDMEQNNQYTFRLLDDDEFRCHSVLALGIGGQHVIYTAAATFACLILQVPTVLAARRRTLMDETTCGIDNFHVAVVR